MHGGNSKPWRIVPYEFEIRRKLGSIFSLVAIQKRGLVPFA